MWRIPPKGRNPSGRRGDLTQTEQVLQWLQSKPLTALEALQHMGCFRLAARVEELRSAGHNIVTQNVNVGNKSYAKYWLHKGVDDERFFGQG